VKNWEKWERGKDNQRDLKLRGKKIGIEGVARCEKGVEYVGRHS